MDIYEILKRLAEAEPEPSHSDMVFTNHPVAIAKTYGHFQAPIVTPYGLAYEYVQYNHGVGYYKTGNNGAAATSVTLASPGKTKVNATSLAIMMYRSEKTFSADGYSLVADSDVTQDGSTQQVSVYMKPFIADSALDELTISQASTVRLDILNVVLAGSNITLTLVDNALVAELPYSPPAKTGKRRLYVMSAAYAANPNTPSLTLNANGLAMQSDGFNRLKVWYDYDPTVNITPTLDRDTTVTSDSYYTNSAVLLTFDIDGTF
jgi:hypothetical protein